MPDERACEPSRWPGFFGPIFALGAVFALVRSLLAGATDRWVTLGYAVMVAIYVAASLFAISNTWSVLARAVLHE